MHEALLGNARAVLRAAEILTRIHQKHDPWPHIMMFSGWAHARLGDREIGMMELRRGLARIMQHAAR
jgi:hypothetical protein